MIRAELPPRRIQKFFNQALRHLVTVGVFHAHRKRFLKFVLRRNERLHKERIKRPSFPALNHRDRFFVTVGLLIDAVAR